MRECIVRFSEEIRENLLRVIGVDIRVIDQVVKQVTKFAEYYAGAEPELDHVYFSISKKQPYRLSIHIMFMLNWRCKNPDPVTHVLFNGFVFYYDASGEVLPAPAMYCEWIRFDLSRMYPIITTRQSAISVPNPEKSGILSGTDLKLCPKCGCPMSKLGKGFGCEDCGYDEGL